jgi:hypothetical protein
MDMRRVMAAIAMALGLAVSGGAAAQATDGGAVSLAIGEEVVVEFAQDGVAVRTRAPAESASRFETLAVADLNSGVHGDVTGDNVALVRVGPKAPPLEAVQPGVLRVRFVAIGEESALSIENGYDQGLVYRARIVVDGETEATDVCLVLPNLRGLEHWPYAIERIELYELRLQPWREGDPIPCA